MNREWLSQKSIPEVNQWLVDQAEMQECTVGQVIEALVRCYLHDRGETTWHVWMFD